ncbi:MAG: GTPase ObgE [Clostridia bacterium]
MFTDKVKIYIKAGNGGNGVVHFHTEKFVSRGGPDGGDGGKGGDIIFVASDKENTLNTFYYKRHYRAPDGSNGEAKNCYGRKGEDMVIVVPVGTIIRDVETGRVMADLFSDGDRQVIMRGGSGGKGNAKYATPRRQAPRFASHGEPTNERQIELELKTIADVGLVGFPNVGKSTLLSVISAARPKIADYHFTTLNPNLGVVDFHNETFTVADIPGLIENASQGAGLGHEFLKHIERTRMIVHVVDMGGTEERNPLEDYEIINKELGEYSNILKELPQIVAANKMDMPNADENLKRFKSRYPDVCVVPIMALIHENLNALLQAVSERLKLIPKQKPLEYDLYQFEEMDKTAFEIIREDDGAFLVIGGLVDNLSRKVVIDDYDSMRFLQRALITAGVIDKLRTLGAKDGSTVRMGDIEFDFVD